MRVRGWFWELCGVFARYGGTRFAWGKHDCVTFAAACVDAVRGAAFLSVVEGRYDNARDAYRAIAKYGGWVGAISHYLGKPSTRRARTGDVALFRQKSGEVTCGVFLGPFLVAPAPVGCRVLWPRRVIAHWSV